MELVFFNKDENRQVLELAPQIKSSLDQGNIAVLKNVFSKSLMSNFIQQVWTWGTGQENQPQDYRYFKHPNFKMHFRNDYTSDNVFGPHSEFDMLKTPTQYTLFRFSQVSKNEDYLSSLLEVTETLERLSNEVGNTSFSFEGENSVKFNLEVNHYPTGGGHMEVHNHLGQYPQPHVNLILALSKKQEDYSQGSTFFLKDDIKIDPLDSFDQGDVLFFPVDLAHGVSACDADHPLNFNNIKGRWTAILPAYNPNVI